jgi:hypothetical protein
MAWEVVALTITNILMGLAVVIPVAMMVAAGLKENHARHHRL